MIFYRLLRFLTRLGVYPLRCLGAGFTIRTLTPLIVTISHIFTVLSDSRRSLLGGVP